MKIVYWIIVITLVVGTFWFAFFKEAEKQPEQQEIVPVEVEQVGTDSIEETIELTGWIEANKTADVRSKVSGRLESLQAALDKGGTASVEEGLVVKKGQQLAMIDHDVYSANVAAAKAGLKAAEVELDDAEREKKRIVALYESGSATAQNRDKAVTAAELASARLDSAKATLELAEINLRESTIRAPINGIVTAKNIDEGNLIGIGDRIITIADMETVKVIVSAAEKYGAKIAVGTPARITVDAFGDRVFNAKVYSIYPALDKQTHTMQIEIRLDNTEYLLKPGMFARVTLITERKENVVVIPRDVILGGKINPHYVYVIEDGIARKRFVELGITEGARSEIIDGLSQDETLVVNGMNFLADGTAVEVVKLEDIK